MRPLKYITLTALIITFATSSCSTNSKSKNSSIENSPENFDWLLGKWERKNEEQGKETFENWEKISAYEYSGIGFTMQSGDTIKQEKIVIIKTKEKWELRVIIPGEQESITFHITELNHSSFTCENDSLDFPKLIKYWKESTSLRASVSGGDLVIPFEFEKIK